MFRKCKLIFIVCLSVFLLAACSTESAKDQAGGKKEVNLLFNFATSSLDPNVDTSYVSLRAGITETLVHLNDKDLTIEPWLAKSWDSKDGQLWNFELREGVTFQNGKPMDGKAVKASLERAMKDSPAIKNALRIESIEADGNVSDH